MVSTPEVLQLNHRASEPLLGGIEVPVLSAELIEVLDELPFPPLRTKPANCCLIEVAGMTLSVGKTTAAEVLGRRLVGSPVIFQPERWRENPFLKNPKQRFQSECWFLQAKATDNFKIGAYPSEAIVVQDVPPELDWLYTATDFALGRINKKEFRSYQELYQVLLPKMVKPDLTVFVECSLEEIFRRVRGRSREFEQIQGERIRALAYLTERWFREIERQLPTLTVDSSALDFCRQPVDQTALAEMVLASLRFLNPKEFGDLNREVVI